MNPGRRLMPGRLLLSPREPLVAGGAAEAFEHQLQQLLRAGNANLVVDLSEVTAIDSAGIRALVRGHTTAQRVGGTLRLAAVPAVVSQTLAVARLRGVFDAYESVEAAQLAAWPWQKIGVIGAGIALCMVLVWAGLRWPPDDGTGAPPLNPFLELSKLVAALLIGALVTWVHRPVSRERPLARSMAHAQMLLCMAGALMMIVIGNSLARAFGVVGAASIIRFRTPVDDPKDVTILFILMGLGMASGLGAFAVAGLGTAFLCLALLALDRFHQPEARLMAVEIATESRDFPAKQVEEVFARNKVVFEPREISQGKKFAVLYHAWLDHGATIDDLSVQLRGIPGITGVGWEQPRRG
jgi:anti-anti-sigma factor